MACVTRITDERVDSYYYTTRKSDYQSAINTVELIIERDFPSFYDNAEISDIPDEVIASLKNQVSENRYGTNLLNPILELIKNKNGSGPCKPLVVEVEINQHSSSNTILAIREGDSHKETKPMKDPYPVAVRYVSEDGTHFIERPPFQVSVNFKESYTSSKSKSIVLDNQNIKIWIPWTITTINMNSLNRNNDIKIFFSDTQLIDNDTKYHICVLPNTYANSNICFANSINAIREDLDNLSLNEYYSSVFNEYMSGGWNTDLDSNIYELIQYRSSYINSSFAKKYPTLYKFASSTVEDVLTANRSLKRSRTLEAHFNNKDSRFHMFSFFFYVMSTFSLEETLSFYSELKEWHVGMSKNSVFSFNEIKHDLVSDGTFTVNKIQKTIGTPYSYKNFPTYEYAVNKHFSIRMVFINYQDFPDIMMYAKDNSYYSYAIYNPAMENLIMEIMNKTLDTFVQDPDRNQHTLVCDVARQAIYDVGETSDSFDTCLELYVQNLTKENVNV